MHKRNIDQKVTIILKLFVVFLHIILCLASIPPVIFLSFVYIFNQIFPMKIIEIFASLYWQIELIIFQMHNKIEIENLDLINSEESYLVVSNHQSNVDFNALHFIALQKESLYCCKYVLKNSLLFVPIFGIGMLLDGFCYLSRNYLSDQSALKKFADKFMQNNLKLWLIIFPEGTRFTEKKYQESVEFCKKKDLKFFKNLLYPRKRGYEMLAESMKGHIKKILAVTIYYEKKVPTLFEMLFKNPTKNAVKIKLNLFENVEGKNNLIEIFEKIDENLENFKNNL